MLNILTNSKRKSLLATILLLQVLMISCKKDKKDIEDPKTLPAVTTMEFYSYNGKSYTDGPHYYNKYILKDLGLPNSVILINGRNFSEDFKGTKVLFNNISSSAIWGNSTQIYVMIPDDVPPGPVTLTINTNGKSIVHPTSFTVEAPDPQIGGISAPSAMVGGRVIISGLNFSTTAAKTSVTINGTAAIVDSVNLTTVYFRVPPNATSGKIVLTTHGRVLSYKDDLNINSSTFITIANLGLRLISLDAAGNIYGTYKNMVYKVTPAGISTMLAKVGSDNNSFNGSGTYFGGSVVDASGTPYFTSPWETNFAYPLKYPDFTLKLMKVLPNGSLDPIAGGSYKAIIDGQGANARFNIPMQLAIDVLTGNFYINDASVIRKVSSSGSVTTVANPRIENGPVTLPNFSGIAGMTVQATTGDVYLINSAYTFIAKITSSGAISTSPISTAPGTTISGSANYAGITTLHLAVNGSNTMYLSVGTNLYQIKDGVVTNTYANPASGDIIGLAIDKTGDLYLTAAQDLNIADRDIKYTIYRVKF